MRPGAGITTGTAAGIAYWRRPGPGKRLVCLHGIGSNAGSFRPMLEHLPADWDVTAWNQPGYGDSEPLPMDWPVEADFAAALDRFLDALGIDRATVLGHSLGTLIGARFAADHPVRVERLILGAAACGHGRPAGGALSEAAAKRIADLEAQGPRAFAEARGPRLLADPEGRPEAKRAVVDAMAAVSMPGYGQAVRMLASGRLEDSLAAARNIETHIIWGTGDVVTPLDQSERAARAAGGTQIHQLPGAGHALHVETPDAFAAAVIAATEGRAPSAAKDKESLT